MSFIGEWIKNKEDRKYVESKVKVRNWAVDRERNIILVSRGGGGLEMPKGYALYWDGVIVDLIGDELWEGNRFHNDLKIHWTINRICVPKVCLEGEDKIENLKQIIKEAFTAYSYRGLKPSQVLEVTVEINTEPVQKYNSKGEEV